MRIAQLTPPSAPVSVSADGFVQRSIALLVDGLVDVGEDVTLVACEGSRTNARLVSTPLDDLSDPEALLAHLTAARPRIGEVDVIHDHTELRTLLAALNGHPGVVHTLRNGAGPTPDDVDRVNVVATTWEQTRRHPEIEFAAVIRDGIRISDHPLTRHRDQRIAYVGPARAEDGPLMAIAVAERLGLELVIAISMQEADEPEYWRDTLAPTVGDSDVRIRLMRVPIDRAERQAVLGRVQALIMPPPMNQALAHLALEAGAVGTPVIAFEGDGADEIVEDRKTGFVLSSVEVDAVAAAVEGSGAIAAARCRRHIADRFSHERMVHQYHELYDRLVDGSLNERMVGHPVGPPSEGSGSPTRTEDLSEDLSEDFSEDLSEDRSPRYGLVATYLAMVAHDIRSPLAAIETVLAHGDDLHADDRDHLLQRIIAISSGLDLAARDILDLDQIERGDIEFAARPVSVSSVVDEALATIDASGHPVELHLREETVHADRPALLRALGNLLTNAVRHTSEGSRISISSWREGSTSVIAIEDDGPGIDDETIEAIQGPGQLSGSWGGGSGLGLALIRRLIDLHGGRLTAHNREGGGASFRIHLPVRTPVEDEAVPAGMS